MFCLESDIDHSIAVLCPLTFLTGVSIQLKTPIGKDRFFEISIRVKLNISLSHSLNLDFLLYRRNRCTCFTLSLSLLAVNRKEPRKKEKYSNNATCLGCLCD